MTESTSKYAATKQAWRRYCLRHNRLLTRAAPYGADSEPRTSESGCAITYDVLFIAGTLSGFDRLVFRGSLRKIAYPFQSAFIGVNPWPLILIVFQQPAKTARRRPRSPGRNPRPALGRTPTAGVTRTAAWKPAAIGAARTRPGPLRPVRCRAESVRRRPLP